MAACASLWISPVEALKAHGAEVINTTEPQSLVEDMFYVSGEIPRVTAFEHGLPTQYGKRWMADGSLIPWLWMSAGLPLTSKTRA